jgi:glycosyltransferase involved in cell wall biosynthesis
MPDFTVSVIISTYNRRVFLLTAIRSVLSQTLPPLEILICDDGSTDGSADAVAALGSSIVRWLPGAHVGFPAVARNRGLREARGRWVAFLDDDDVWLPEKLAVQKIMLDATGLPACCSDAFRVGLGYSDNERLLSHVSGIPERLDFFTLVKGNRVICGSLIVKRDILLDLGGFPENITGHEDYALWLRLTTTCSISVVNLPLLKYTDMPSESLRSKDPVITGVAKRRVFINLLVWDHFRDGNILTSSQKIRVIWRWCLTWGSTCIYFYHHFVGQRKAPNV